MEWTDGRVKGFIVGVLRSGARRWPPRYETLKEACVGKKENKKTKRMAMHYKCAECKKEFPAKEVNIDHKDPVVSPIDGFIDWNTFIDRLYCPKENLQCLCLSCHKIKSQEERNAKNHKGKKE